MKKLLLISGLSALVFTSCLVGPKYDRPAMMVNTGYAGGDSTVVVATVVLDSAAIKDSISLIGWTEVYKDPALTNLIKTVLSSNLDLLTAIARVEEARATYGISKAVLYPSFGYSLNAGIGDIGENAQKMGAGIDGQSYGGYATMSWELDLFGKLRHQKRSARAQFLATENNAQAVRVSLIAETASLYFSLRDADNRLDIAKRTVISRTESLKTISERFNQGYVSELDQLQAQQQLATAMAAVPNAERDVITIQNALRVLTGLTPGAIERGQSIYDQQLPPEIPAGIPSDLLRRRPDIIAAEQTLISQTEEIGVATAMRFPSISLTGFFGAATSDLATIVDPASMAFGLSGGILGPVFEFGKNKRRVEAQRYQADQYSYQYQKTVLNAFAEVDNSLASLRLNKQQYEAYKSGLEAAKKAYILTEARYFDGYSNYLELLIQQDNLFAAEFNESAAQTQQNIAVVNLFKALGGGW
ncbi:MAG: efflux transporter outer membrane subunit [Lentimicrobium sp.]|nr:efflux transporter outer membrane subunit [Lentimicrobium sp.]